MWEVKKLYSFNIDHELETLAYTVPELEGAEKQILSLINFIHPKIHWVDMEIKHKNKDCISMVDLTGNLFTIESSYVAKGLWDCQKATLIAATIGDEISKDSNRRYNKGNFWEGIIGDRFGSYAMEILVEKFHKYLTGSYMSKGLYSSLRFSPGYGDWLLHDQRKILDLLDTEPDITVNSFDMLEPIKSVTALIGWAMTPQVSAYPMGEKSRGLCHGKTSCQACTTWACKGE